MNSKVGYNDLSVVDDKLAELLNSDLPFPIRTIGDLATPGVGDAVTMAKDAEKLRRSIWRVQSARASIVPNPNDDFR